MHASVNAHAARMLTYMHFAKQHPEILEQVPLGLATLGLGTPGLQATPGIHVTGTFGFSYLWIRYPRVAGDTRKSWNIEAITDNGIKNPTQS